MNTNRKKYRLFYKLEQHLEIPMFLLALLWLYFFFVELFRGLTATQETIIGIIWGIFIVEFLLKLVLAPRKWQYLKHNWITFIALVLPALRVFRALRTLRLLRSVRVVNSTKVVRALTSGRRFFSALREAQGPEPGREMHVGVIMATAKPSSEAGIKTFAQAITDGIRSELEESTNLEWYFDVSDTISLDNDDSRRPSDFLDSASLKMVSGPYDLVCVLTDVPLMSRRNHMEPGLVSNVGRIMVISTWELTRTGRKEARAQLSDENVQRNGSLLFLHLVGHLLGLKDVPAVRSSIMGKTDFKTPLLQVPSFTAQQREKLKKRAKRAPERELRSGNFLESFIFHILMTLRHPKDFFYPLLRNWAVLLPLSLPGLATAAFAPALVLIFTAEIWDVGLGMSNATASFFSVISILFGSFYLVRVQSLFLPRKEKSLLTEHLAVTNSVIFFSIFLACIGLFILVGALMMVIELYVFPEGLMQTWPTLDHPEVLLQDQIRLAAFISTIGVTTGALAGGLESRKVIQHLALFRKRV